MKPAARANQGSTGPRAVPHEYWHLHHLYGACDTTSCFCDSTHRTQTILPSHQPCWLRGRCSILSLSLLLMPFAMASNNFLMIAMGPCVFSCGTHVRRTLLPACCSSLIGLMRLCHEQSIASHQPCWLRGRSSILSLSTPYENERFAW